MLACPGTDEDGEGGSRRRIVLAGFDARTGEERFRLAVPHATHAPEQVSLPAPAPDGRIAQLVRRRDRIALLVVEPGPGGAVTEVEPALAALAQPDAARLDAPIATGGDGYLASWGLSESGAWSGRARSWRVELLRGAGEPPLWWVDDERVLGVHGEVVVLRSVGGPLRRLVGRRLATGALVWERAFGAGTRVEMAGGRLLALDRGGRLRERLRRGEAFRRRRVERVAADPIGSRGVDWDAERRSFHRGLPRLPAMPVLGLDPATGEDRFRVELPGDPAGPVVGGPHLACVVYVDEEGVGAIARIRGEDGTDLGRRGFHVDEEFHDRSPASPAFPRLIAADHTHLLWQDGAALVCEVLADPGREVWRLPLGEPLPAPPEPEPIEPELPPVAVAHGRIAVRDATGLHLFAADAG